MRIENDGPRITATDYWQSEWAQRGYVYVSVNAGAVRLLLPREIAGLGSANDAITEMRSARECLITRGLYHGRDAYELLYEDGSDSPYVLHIGIEQQADRAIPASEAGRTIVHTVWTRGFRDDPVCALTLPARFRVAPTLPYLKAWRA